MKRETHDAEGRKSREAPEQRLLQRLRGSFLRERAFARRTFCERKIEYTKVEGEISSCKFFFLIVKFACPMEASPFLTDPRIWLFSVLFLLSSCCIARYRKDPGRWYPGQLSQQ